MLIQSRACTTAAAMTPASSTDSLSWARPVTSVMVATELFWGFWVMRGMR